MKVDSPNCECGGGGGGGGEQLAGSLVSAQSSQNIVLSVKHRIKLNDYEEVHAFIKGSANNRNFHSHQYLYTASSVLRKSHIQRMNRTQRPI